MCNTNPPGRQTSFPSSWSQLTTFLTATADTFWHWEAVFSWFVWTAEGFAAALKLYSWALGWVQLYVYSNFPTNSIDEWLSLCAHYLRETLSWQMTPAAFLLIGSPLIHCALKLKQQTATAPFFFFNLPSVSERPNFAHLNCVNHILFFRTKGSWFFFFLNNWALISLIRSITLFMWMT